MNKVNVIIVMGSKSDLDHANKIKAAAENFGLLVSMHVASAHKTAAHLIQLLEQYENISDAKVYVTIAGRSNALSGFVDGYVNAPVIACPPQSNAFGGADIFSSLRMPSGVAPAVVLAPENAALLAAKILSLHDESLLARVKEYKLRQIETILSADKELND
ncbi:MAG: AIR carboxylase family protein [Anaerolineaceae bacterium]|nr:AIR carboxylase family protein [Anaerolineaceae bacterium]